MLQDASIIEWQASLSHGVSVLLVPSVAGRAAFCTYTPWLVITEIQDPAGVSLDKTPWQHFLETAWGQSNRKPATTPSLTANIVGTDNILFP